MTYAARKGIDLQLDATGGAEEVDGTIVIPIVDLESDEQIAKQIVTSGGEKRFHGTHAGHIAGTYVGTATDRLYVCEGWADAVIINRLTGHQALWALNSSNLPKVAHWASVRFAERQVVIAADFDRAGIKPLIGSPALDLCVFIHPPCVGEDWWDLARRDGAVAKSILMELKPACLEQAALATGLKSASLPKMEILSLDDMLDRLVFITAGSQVLDRKNPQSTFSKTDFRNALLASKEEVSTGEQKKLVNAFDLWMKHPDRTTLDAITFRAGASEKTLDPEGRHSYNTWRQCKRSAPPPNWKELAEPFFSHIQWLFGEDSEAFCDWLAHIEQCPGTLPHYGWLHIASQHGLGRNWLAGVLHRIWPSYVASNFNLSSTLNSGFNGALSRKLLATVDEIDEGNSGKAYQHAQTLKQLVTEETRLINPKFGLMSKEWNSCRWLVFSNKLSALPLEDGDRRFWVVNSEENPRGEDYYRSLYRLIDDRAFIEAVAHSLSVRDIQNFNPGQRPPLNKAKLAVLARTRTEFDNVLAEIRERWPVDLITSAELKDIVGEDEWPNPAALKHALDRAGFVKLYHDFYYDYTSRKRKRQVYCLRNHSEWNNSKVGKPACNREIHRVRIEDKIEAITDYK